LNEKSYWDQEEINLVASDVVDWFGSIKKNELGGGSSSHYDNGFR